MNNGTLDIGNIFVVFQRLDQSIRMGVYWRREELHTRCNKPAFSQRLAIFIMGETFIAQDSINDLRSMDEVELQQTDLQVALFGFIFFESIQQKGCRGLNHILQHENVNDL